MHSAKNITGDAYGIGSTVGINTTLRRVTVSVSSTEGIGIGSGFTLVDSLGVVYMTLLRMTLVPLLQLLMMVSQELKLGPVIIRTRDLKESFT